MFDLPNELEIALRLESLSQGTKARVLDEIFQAYRTARNTEGNHMYPMLRDVLDTKTTFRQEFEKLGTAKFLREGGNIGIFKSNFDLTRKIDSLDKAIGEYNKNRVTSTFTF
jgi:hypothetical protein